MKLYGVPNTCFLSLLLMKLARKKQNFGVGKLQSTKLTCVMYTNFDSSTRGFVVLLLTEMEYSTFQWGFPLF